MDGTILEKKYDIVKRIEDLEEGGSYVLPVASDDTLGGVKIGENLEIEEDGTLNAQGTGFKITEIYKGEKLANNTTHTIEGLGNFNDWDIIVFYIRVNSPQDTHIFTIYPKNSPTDYYVADLLSRDNQYRTPVCSPASFATEVVVVQPSYLPI